MSQPKAQDPSSSGATIGIGPQTAGHQGRDATESIDERGLAAALPVPVPVSARCFLRVHRLTSCLFVSHKAPLVSWRIKPKGAFGSAGKVSGGARMGWLNSSSDLEHD